MAGFCVRKPGLWLQLGGPDHVQPGNRQRDLGATFETGQPTTSNVASACCGCCSGKLLMWTNFPACKVLKNLGCKCLMQGGVRSQASHFVVSKSLARILISAHVEPSGAARKRLLSLPAMHLLRGLCSTLPFPAFSLLPIVKFCLHSCQGWCNIPACFQRASSSNIA